MDQEEGSIEIKPSSATLRFAGVTVQMKAVAYDTGNAPIPGAPVEWSSGNPSVASLDDNGLVIAVSNGTTRIMAASSGVSIHASITVDIGGT